MQIRNKSRGAWRQEGCGGPERDCFLPVDPGSEALRKRGCRREDFEQEGGVMSLPDLGPFAEIHLPRILEAQTRKRPLAVPLRDFVCLGSISSGGMV